MATEEAVVKMVLEHLQASNTSVGDEFYLEALFTADEWNEDYLDESVTWFGRRFKKAVRAKRVPEAAWLRKTDTNLNIYRRVA